MLIYNHKKEFIGIDETDLKRFGFTNLAQLRSEAADFADLFVRTPGHVHNFKHVHWIDFVTCAESLEESKVIIDVNGKSFKAYLVITTAYLSDDPHSKAYIVTLNNLQLLTSSESDTLSHDIAQKPEPAAFVPPQETPMVTTPVIETPPVPNIEPTPAIQESPIPQTIELSEPVIADEYDTVAPVAEETPQAVQEATIPDVIEIDDIDFDKEIPPVIEEPTQVDTDFDENFDYEYQYDPQVASDELGLPLDLIEEFIQDFIAQAHDFKEGLYSALREGDLDNVKILSHKLKGVAANLRIEDAFNTLTIINTSEDTDEILSYLNTFYKIIAKLSGEEIKATKAPQQAEQTETLTTDDDLYEDIILPDEDEIAPPLEEELELETETEADDDLYLDINLDDEETPAEEPKVQKPSISYSKEQVANEIGLDSETFHELFEDFITESKHIMTNIKTAYTNHDIDTLKKEVVKLKGMSDNMRIESLNAPLQTLLVSTEEASIDDALNTIENTIATISQ